MPSEVPLMTPVVYLSPKEINRDQLILPSVEITRNICCEIKINTMHIIRMSFTSSNNLLYHRLSKYPYNKNHHRHSRVFELDLILLMMWIGAS